MERLKVRDALRGYKDIRIMYNMRPDSGNETDAKCSVGESVGEI